MWWAKVPAWVWLLIVVFVLGYSLHQSGLKVQKYKKEADVYENTISNLNQQIKQTEIKMNDSITLYQAEVKNLNYSIDNLKAQYSKLLKSSRLRARDVQSITNIATKVEDRDTVVAVKDTTAGIKAMYCDQFVKINVNVLYNMKTVIDYEIRDSLSVINVQKKHSILFGLIKWKSLESTRVINHNPKARIVGLETINVVE